MGMTQPSSDLLKEFSGAAPASTAALATAEQQLGLGLPDDYKAFLLRHNGGEGFIGKHYLILWAAEELGQFNQQFEVDQYAPGLLMFGSTGGGDGFAFDTRGRPFPVVQVPFIGMSLKDASPVARNFNELLTRMRDVDRSLF